MLIHRGRTTSTWRRGVAAGAALLAGLSGAQVIAMRPAAAAPPSTELVLQYFAGTGTAGAAVPGPAASSPLNTPMGTAFDSQGNTYVSTYGTNACQVLKVTPDGTLSVFAGAGACTNATPGPALSSGLNKPTNLTVDSNDNLYVLEDVGNRALRITPAGTLSVVAGNGSSSGAIVEGPATQSPMRISGMVLDSADNLYLGDWVRGHILKVNPSGVLSIIAGNGTTTVTPGPARQSGMRGPYGVALDSQGNLYATDYYLHYVYKITSDGTLSIFAGTGGTTAPTAGPATASALYRPWDVDVDASDNVYVSLSGAPSIVGITPGGTLSMVAGTGVSGSTVPGPATATPLRSITYMAFDGPTLYYADLSGHRINRLLPGLAPDAPANLTGEPGASGSGSITLSFDAPSGNGSAVQAYQVSTDDGVTWGPLVTSGSGPVTGTVSGLDGGRSYTLRVRAVNAVGPGPGSASDTVVASAGPPGAPTALQADPRHQAVDLTFTVPAEDGGEPISSYEVSVDDGDTWQNLTVTGSGASRTATVPALTDGQQYTVRVRARNSVGAGAASGSTIVTPVPSAPGVPGNFTVQRGNAAATVAFDPPTDSGGSAVTSYDASTDDGATWNPLTTTGTTRRTGTVSGLTNGQEYPVRVRARNIVGPGTSTVARAVTPATTPGAPADLTADRRDGGAALSFGPPAVTGGAVITAYEVSVDNGATWQDLVTSGTSPMTGTVPSLTNGQEYAVRVRARNGVGAGTASAAVTVVPATVPAAPGDLQVVPGDGSATVTFGVPAGNGSAVTSYEVSVDGGDTWQTLAVTGSGATRTGTASSLTNGAEYTVRVRARNAVGDGAPSDAVTVTPVAVPNPPSGLAVAGGNGVLHLVFTAAEGNGSPVLRHEVSLDDGATWATLETGVAGDADRTGTVTGLVNGTVYPVRVRAVNSVGAGPAGDAVTGAPAAAVPGAPADPAATPGNGFAGLTFVVPADNGSAILGYKVSVDDGASWQPLAVQDDGSTATATLSGLDNGATYTVRVRAHNEVGPGDASAPVEVTPRPDQAGAPSRLSVSSGNNGLVVRFQPPDDTGGSAVNGYQVSVDNGTTWVAADTSTTGDGESLAASVTGLTNGVSYAVRVRAVTAAGAGASGDAVTVVPGIPGTPLAVSAVAGVSSITVTWEPPSSTDVPVVGYLVIAEPGPASCRPAAGQRSCVLSAVAGRQYRVRVVAETAAGLEASSPLSRAVTPRGPAVPATAPAAPTTLTTDKGKIGLAVPGQAITVIGTGFAPLTTITVMLYSEPITLGTAVTDATGSFALPVTIPAGLDPGAHTFLASGVDPAGATRQMALPVTVAPTSAGSTGEGTDTQNTILPVPANGLITLLDGEGMPAVTVTVPQGTYALDAATGAITFVPVAGLAGKAAPVAYRITDSVGSVVTGSYTATVTGSGGDPAPAPVPGPRPSTGSAKVVVARLAVTRGVPARATLPAIVSFTTVTRARNTAVLWSTMSGRRVVLGTGRATMRVAGRRAAVTIVLNPLGRALAATPGGYPVAVAVTTVPVNGGRTLRASSRTRLVLHQFTVPRSVYFSSGSAAITGAQSRYLTALRTTLTGVRTVTCVGHTDDRGNKAASLRLGERRARAVCRGLTTGPAVRTSIVTRGETNPSGSNSTSAGMARNRRVDITIHY
jgi:titin